MVRKITVFFIKIIFIAWYITVFVLYDLIVSYEVMLHLNIFLSGKKIQKRTTTTKTRRKVTQLTIL